MANKYKNFDIIRNNVKIYKFQNNKSALDLTHLLGSYREKTKNETTEYIYSGRLRFAISADGIYQQAFLTKGNAKLLFETIRSGTFSKFFPEGFQDFGGGEKDGKIYSKKLEIKFTTLNGKTKAVVNIEEMPGQRTNTGAFKPTGKAYEKANSMLDPIDLLEMAIEGYDFIQAAEVVGMSERKPMNTLTNLNYEKVGDSNQNVSSSEPNDATDNTKDIKSMSSREFYNYYMQLKKEFEDAQKEYNLRVEQANK